LTLFWAFFISHLLLRKWRSEVLKKKLKADLEPAPAGSPAAVVGLGHQSVGEQTTTDTTDCTDKKKSQNDEARMSNDETRMTNPCYPRNPRFSLSCSCLFVLIRGYCHFLYAGTSGKTGGCNSPSSSSSLGLTGNPPGVTSRAVTKITKLRLMC
jgi:hypothetical protein